MFSASTLLINVSVLLRQFSSSAALAGTNGPISAKARLEHARALLSLLLTFGISESIDNICVESLSIVPQPAMIGLANVNGLSLLPQTTPTSPWTLSPQVSAERALAILSILQYLTQFEGRGRLSLAVAGRSYHSRSCVRRQYCHDILRSVDGSTRI